MTVNVFAVNDAPVVAVAGSTPTYTEGGSAVLLFSGASVNTVEAGQSISQMVFTITNLANGASEKLVIDGTGEDVAGDARNGSSLVVNAMADALACAICHVNLSRTRALTGGEFYQQRGTGY